MFLFGFFVIDEEPFLLNFALMDSHTVDLSFMIMF